MIVVVALGGSWGSREMFESAFVARSVPVLACFVTKPSYKPGFLMTETQDRPICITCRVAFAESFKCWGMNRRSCICKECWSIHGDAQTAEERGCRGVGGQRRYSLYCPRCNCDWERDFPGYVCILQHVVTQGPDFCKTGWFLLVNFDSNSAIIIEFVDTESFYHTQGGISFKSFVWQGSIDKLIRMARLLQNPEFPEHRLVPEDFNYQHWCCFYDGISAWAGHCSLDWSATCRRVPMPWAHVPAPFGLPECGHNQLPFAKNLKGLLNQSRAATVIQAAWRGWKTRMSVLWNPHTVIGQRRLAAEAGKETNKGKQGLCC